MDITTTVRLPEELHEKLREQSYKEKISQNDIIVLALRSYFAMKGVLILKKLNQE